MYRRLLIFTLIIASIFINSLASAGSFKAMPSRFFLDPKSKTGVLTITNDGDEKITIQIEAKSWRQDDKGMDVYGDTDDVIFFPKIADIEKGGQRILRFGYKGGQTAVEKAYKLLLQELPVGKPGTSELKFIVTMRIPVFMPPVKAITDWTAESAGLSEEKLLVKITNTGNEHITVDKVTATGRDGSGKEVFSRKGGGQHVLAGAFRIFPVIIPQEDCLKAKTINVTVDAERGSEYERMSRQFTMNVDQQMCNKTPLMLKKPD